MNIAGLENSISRVYKYASQFENYDSVMYRKSYLRLLKMKEMLVQSLHFIDKYQARVEGTLPSIKNTHISSGDNSSLAGKVDYISDKLDVLLSVINVAGSRLNEMVDYTPHKEEGPSTACNNLQTKDKDSVSNEQTEVACHTDSSENSKQSSNDKPRKLKSDKKILMAHFAKTINDTYNNASTVESKDCMEMIKKWFETRFSRSNPLPYGYNCKKIGDYIQYIILSYGKAMHEHDLDSFKANFYNWLDNLKDCNYILPYDIYKYSDTRNLDESNFTDEGAMLSYTLMSDGINKITDVTNLKDVNIISNLATTFNSVRKFQQFFLSHKKLWLRLGTVVGRNKSTLLHAFA